MKSHFHHTDETLVHLNLSHMDFLDDPAATHGSRLTISRFTKDERPNELVNPEIWSNNHLKLGALPLGEGGGAKHSPPGHACDSLVLPWFFLVLRWFFLGSSLILPWFILGSSFALPWLFLNSSLVLLLFFLCSSLVRPWFFMGSSSVLPWFILGSSLVFICSSLDLPSFVLGSLVPPWCLENHFLTFLENHPTWPWSI